MDVPSRRDEQYLHIIDGMAQFRLEILNSLILNEIMQCTYAGLIVDAAIVLTAGAIGCGIGSEDAVREGWVDEGVPQQLQGFVQAQVGMIEVEEGFLGSRSVDCSVLDPRGEGCCRHRWDEAGHSRSTARKVCAHPGAAIHTDVRIG